MTAPAAHVDGHRRAPRPGVANPLAPDQMRWLGLLLFSVQLPLVPYVPVWIALFGIALVGARFAMLRREPPHPGGPAPMAGRWLLLVAAIVTGAAIRRAFGYFAGRDPCVAFLFVLLGIKFLETRSSRDGALLVCLSGFLAVALFFYTQSPLAALEVLPAVVLIAATLQQLTLPAGGAPGLTRWRPVIGGAARMLAQGVPLAALLFLFVPRLSAPLWGLPADHVAKTGLSERMTPGFISELSLSDAVAFRVDFDREPPPPAQRYWRGPVLSEFDGEGWSISGGPAPGRFERSSRDTVAYTVTLEPHDKLWLFALEFPAALPVATGTEDVPRAAGIATLSSEQQLLALAPVTQPMQYRQVSRPGADFPVGDRARLLLEQEANRRLPPGFARLNPRTVALARELRDRFADDDALARAVLDHFHAEPFVYTLTPPRLGRNAQDAFLFDTRRGFCEHYASAFVFLLRAAGVPARVVTGYQGGEMNPRGNYMIVRQSDAHAWAEALIDGRWRRFDPTAAVSPSRIEWGLGGALPFGEPVPLLARLDSSWQKSLQLAWDAVNHDWRHVVIGFNRERQQSLLRELALDERPAWHTAALISGLCASWLGALLGWLTWKKRRRDPVHAVWSALGLRLARAGLPREPQEGPLAYMDRATRRWPEFAAAFGVIGAAYAQLRYGAEPIDHADQQRRIALSTLKRALQVLPRARRLARMNTLPFKPVEGT